MKRNWELIREILLALEEMPDTNSVLEPDKIEGYHHEEVSYHVRLLDEAGLIEANCSESMNGPLFCWASRLTWYGHEFLDEIKSDTVWNKTKKLLSDKGIALSFEAISTAVKSVIGAMLESL